MIIYLSQKQLYTLKRTIKQKFYKQDKMELLVAKKNIRKLAKLTKDS